MLDNPPGLNDKLILQGREGSRPTTKGKQMNSIVGTSEWNTAMDEYAAAMNAGTPEGWAHASCDHASGYCAETVTNVFETEVCTLKILISTYKAKKAAQRELEWWLGAFPEFNPIMTKSPHGYHVARDFYSADEGTSPVTIEVWA